MNARNGQRGAWCSAALPGAYLLHLIEELWGGEGFVAWAARELSPRISLSRFFAINAVAWPAMVVGVVLARRVPALRWLSVGIAVILGINGVAHWVSSVATWSYSPGVVTGTLLYLPLAGWWLRQGWIELPRGLFWRAVGWGILVHALVVIAAFVV